MTTNTTATQTVTTPALTKIAEGIKTELNVMGKASMVIGGLLVDARGEFKNTKSFLAWAEAEVSLKKSSVHKLMNVYKAFGDCEELDTMSPDALALLLGETNSKEKNEVIAKAIAYFDEHNKCMTIKQVKEALDKASGKPSLSRNAENVSKPEATKPTKAANNTTTEPAAQPVIKPTESKEYLDLDKQFKKAEEDKAKARKVAKEKADELELAKVKIAQLEADNASLLARIAELEAQATTELSCDDLPWETEEEEETAMTEEGNIAPQSNTCPTLQAFKTKYDELASVNAAKSVQNTIDAAVHAGISYQGEGRKLTFSYNEKTLKASELRVLASQI